jgi:hypothetical protein
MHTRPLPAALTVLTLALAEAARAADEPAPSPAATRLIASTFTVARYYPAGADQQIALKLKQRIGDSEDLLFRTRFWSVEAMGAWNPANWSARVSAEVEPIAVFQLRAAYDVRGFFGVLGAVLSSTSPDQDITDAAITASTARDEDYPGVVQSLSVEPTLQVAFGPIGIRNTFTWSYGTWNARAGDLFVYDPGPDLLVPASGVTLTNSATVVYLGERFMAGALYQWLNPLGVPGNQAHRVGVIGSFTFFDRGPVDPGWFNKPTVLAIALFHPQHRGRAGWFPTLIAAFSTETDLLGPSLPRAAAP